MSSSNAIQNRRGSGVLKGHGFDHRWLWIGEIGVGRTLLSAASDFAFVLFSHA